MTVRDDRILPETRLAVIPVIMVLFSAFVTLYFWPEDTERLFAWTIRPRMTPLVMGSGYLAGAYAFAHVLTRARWHHVAFAFLAVEPFTVAMAAATLLHWDRFNHSHPWFWVWVVVYAVTPILLPLLWLRNRRTDPGTPDDVMLPNPVRRLLYLGGLGGAVVAAFLFLLPEAAIQVWPWMLTPLTSRIIGGWFALSAATALVTARDGRWSAVRIAVRTSVLFAALQLVGILRAWGDFNPANPLTWGYVALVVGTLVGFIALYVSMERRRSQAGSTEALGTAS
jgi:peptidoglycan/LPS O-acetylase OafA/YrhL